MHNLFHDPIGKKILGAFGPSYNQWRSLGGIGRAAGLPQEEVSSYINQQSTYRLVHSISHFSQRNTPLSTQFRPIG